MRMETPHLTELMTLDLELLVESSGASHARDRQKNAQDTLVTSSLRGRCTTPTCCRIRSRSSAASALTAPSFSPELTKPPKSSRIFNRSSLQNHASAFASHLPPRKKGEFVIQSLEDVDTNSQNSRNRASESRSSTSTTILIKPRIASSFSQPRMPSTCSKRSKTRNCASSASTKSKAVQNG